MRLASYRLGSEPHELVRLMKGGTRVAVIANAIDNRAPEERRYRLDREMNDLADLGLEADELDLRDYFGREDELREQLSTVEAVFVRGGDVLILALAIRESGMGEILKERLAEDTLVFAGYSAGSCVLGPRLPVFEPSAPPENRFDHRGLEHRPVLVCAALRSRDGRGREHVRNRLLHRESRPVRRPA